MQKIQVFSCGRTTPRPNTHIHTQQNPLHIIQHILPGNQPPCPHQRTRCLKFSPSLSPIQINSRRNAEEVYCVGVEYPLIEFPTKQCVWGVKERVQRHGEKGTEPFHALLTRSAKLLNVKPNFSICYWWWMRPPDKGFGESVTGGVVVVGGGGGRGIRSRLCFQEIHEGRILSAFRVDQTFLTAPRIDD